MEANANIGIALSFKGIQTTHKWHKAIFKIKQGWSD